MWFECAIATSCVHSWVSAALAQRFTIPFRCICRSVLLISGTLPATCPKPNAPHWTCWHCRSFLNLRKTSSGTWWNRLRLFTPDRLRFNIMATLYTVFVDDNFHYMDESERYKLGEFADCASAVAACKQIV